MRSRGGQEQICVLLFPTTLLVKSQLRTQIQRLTQNLEQFTTQHEQLNRKIADLEQTYQRLTGYSLVTHAHVPS